MNAYEVRDVPTKDIETLYGTFHYNRTALRPMNAKDRKRYEELTGERGNVYPLDLELRVNTLPFRISCKALAHIVETSIRGGSFSEGQSVMAGKLNKESSLIYAAKYTEFAGGVVFKRDSKEAEEALKIVRSAGGLNGETGAPRGSGSQNRLYIILGSSFIHYRDKTEGESGREIFLYAAAFKEEDVDYLYDERGRACSFEVLKKEVTAFVGKGEDFAPFAALASVRAGYTGVGETVVLSDGSTFAKKVSEELFPGSLYFIRLEAVRAMADEWLCRLKLSPGRRDDYMERISASLYEGDIDSALETIALHRFDKMPDEKSTLCIIPGGYGRFYDFVRDNRELMRYDGYRNDDIFIGAGADDVSGDEIIKRGLKIRSLNLRPDDLQSVLSVYALFYSGRFSELVPLLEDVPVK